MSWANVIKKPAPAVFVRPQIEQLNVDLSRLVTIDFETYYDDDYTLRKLSTSEYVRDSRFEVLMMGIKVGNKPTRIVEGPKVRAELAKINWATHTLLCHHTQFDGFILSHHYGVHPSFLFDTLSMARGLHSSEIGAGLDEVSVFYGGAGKIQGGVEDMKGLRFAQLFKDKPRYRRASTYCGNDVDETIRIFKEMLPTVPADEMRIIDVTCRLFTDPVLRVDLPRVQKELTREVKEKEDLLISVTGKGEIAKQIVVASATKQPKRYTGWTPREIVLEEARKTIASNESFADLLRAEGIDPPRKISPAYFKHRDDSKKWAYAFAKTDLEFTALQEHPKKRVRDLVETRLSVKSTIGETRAGRFLKAGEAGAHLPVYLKYYGAHCVTGDVEVLTPDGWRRLDEWQGSDIAQVHPDRRIEFLPAERFEGPAESNWLEVDAAYLKAQFTLGHTMPVLRHGTGAWSTEQAENFISAASRKVPLAGVLQNLGEIGPNEARVLAMVQADGSFCEDISQGRACHIFVKKARKIERARQLLTAANVLFDELTFDSWPGYVRFVIRHRNYPKWLTPERKIFGAWLLTCSTEGLTALVDELQHWDGWVQGGQQLYSTSVKANAEWAQTACHLTGRSASLHEKPARGNRKTNYVVAIRQRNYGEVKSKAMRLVERTQQTFCTVTKTGFWLARSQGRVFITGNTGRWAGGNRMNLQNLERGGELRKSIMAAAGHVLVVADSGQIEARVNAWLWGQDDLLHNFRLADAGLDRDAYCKFGDVIYGRKIVKGKDDLERFIAKTATLGLGFQMGAPKFQATLARGIGGPPVFMELDQCQMIVNTYRRRNAKIVAGWRICERIIGDMAAGRTGSYKCLSWEKETLWLPNGMALKYPGLRSRVEGEWVEWSYKRKDQDAKIYGGLLCLAGDTEVLTDAGWKRITTVSIDDRVWDGEAWVSHDGLAYRGTKSTIDFGGVRMTPDHKVLVNGDWFEAQHTTHAEATSSFARHHRTPARDVGRRAADWLRRAKNAVAVALRLQPNTHLERNRVSERQHQDVRLRYDQTNFAIAHTARYEQTPGLPRVAQHESSLRTTNAPSVEKLWWSRHQSLPRLELLREVLGRYGRNVPSRVDARACKERSRVQQEQLCVGDLQAASQQPPTSEAVFDLINAGPNRRFTVRGSDGRPFIVHNCENIVQALARIIVAGQLLAVSAKHRVVMTTHDEIVAMVKKALGQKVYDFMLKTMRTPPPWCSDIPLSAEGGFDAIYSK